jgi:lysozyme
MLAGCDISNYQGPSIDWAAVKASGVVWAIAKATEGTGYRDPTFARNWAEMKRVGIVRGAYHFSRPDSGAGPTAEADAFLQMVGPLSPGDIVVCDIEVGSGDLSGWLLTWLRHVEAAVGFRPWVYTGQWFAAGKLIDPAIGQYPLWASGYTDRVVPPWAPWTLLSAWQWTDRAAVAGVPGRCDADWFLGDATALAKLGKPGAVPVTPPPTFPTAAAYTVAVPAPGTEMYLRLTPRLDAPHGALVHNGEILDADNTVAPAWTTSWRLVKSRVSGSVGYALAANLTAR